MDTGDPIEPTSGSGEIREVTERAPLEPNHETQLTQQLADFFKQFSPGDRMIIHNREQRRLANRQMKQRSKRKRKSRR